MTNFILPDILECRYFKTKNTIGDGARTVYDYEIDFNLSSGRKAMINGETYDVKAGSVLTRRPGDKLKSFGDYDVYLLTLDYSHNKSSSGYDRNLTSDIQPACGIYYWDIIPTHFIPAHAIEIQNIYRQLLYTYSLPQKKEAAALLVTELLHLLTADAVAEKYGGTVPEQNCVEMVLAYICGNYRKRITLDGLAQLVHLNKSYLVRLFGKEVGMSPIEYLIDVRIKNAMNLLVLTDMKLSDIAEVCGWADTSFFIRQFRQKNGITPDEYRKDRNDRNDK